MRFFDRTRTETDWLCPRKRYLQFEYDGRGIVPVEEQLPLAFGIAVHQGLARLIREGPSAVPTIIDDAPSVNPEVDALFSGMMHGAARYLIPSLLNRFEIVAVEREITTVFDDDLMFGCIPDLIGRDRETGLCWYIEYKTTSDRSASWVNAWNRAVQLHAGAYLAHIELDIPMAGCIVIGLSKGSKYKGSIRSPFVHAFIKPGSEDAHELRSYEYVRGWNRVLTTELDGGVERWMEQMPPALLADQFIETPPIPLRHDLVAAFFDQQQRREAVVAHGQIEDFPQNFSACDPARGYPCPYLACCWSPQVGRDPIGSGQFVVRESHHPAEIALWEERELAPARKETV